MDNSYDAFTEGTARYPRVQNNDQILACMYCALGLAGEAGEAVDKIKKWHRDGTINREAVALELGDTLYYLTRLANELGYSLEEVQQMNIEKLTSRKERGVLHGSGDYR
jgi:NTP pyrophosphatase (non-canonical NTP hydrolase)